MRILFITDNFPPEVNAPATRTYEHCKEWVKLGADITIITCFPNFPQGVVYDGYRNKLYSKEITEGIKVIRVWSYITANEGFLKRTLDYFSFAVMATIAGLFVKTDTIIATSPQFFAAAAGRWLSFLKRKPWIMEVRDLWPESIKNMNAMKTEIGYRFLEWWEKRLYRTSKKIVVVTDAFKKYIINKGISSCKIDIITNGANLDLYEPHPKDSNLLAYLGLKGKFIVSYIGTHGMAHKIDFILQCAANCKNSDIHFLFVGTGAEKTKLLKIKENLALRNVTMLDPVSKNDVPAYLSITDVSLINLKKSELYKTVIPSKIFETAAMQIPILLGVDGESREIIEHYNAGLFFEPENEKDFFEKLEILITQRDLYDNCKEGCKYLAINYNRKSLAVKMFEIIKNSVN